MFNRKEIKEKAKSDLKANYWMCVLVAFIFGVLTSGYAVISYIKKVDTSFIDTLKNGADTIYTSTIHLNVNTLTTQVASFSFFRKPNVYLLYESELRQWIKKLYQCPHSA